MSIITATSSPPQRFFSIQTTLRLSPSGRSLAIERLATLRSSSKQCMGRIVDRLYGLAALVARSGAYERLSSSLHALASPAWSVFCVVCGLKSHLWGTQANGHIEWQKISPPITHPLQTHLLGALLSNVVREHRCAACVSDPLSSARVHRTRLFLARVSETRNNVAKARSRINAWTHGSFESRPL